MDLYNDSHEKVCILSGIKETCITSTLKTGDKEITFEFRKTNRYAADIKEEGYIRTDTDEFVIKQVEPSGEQETTAAKQNGDRWDKQSFSEINLMYEMCTMITCSTNSQGKFGNGNSQSDNFLQTGTLNGKGQFFGYTSTTQAVKVFYCENFFANYWKRLRGLLLINGVYHVKAVPPYNSTGAGYTNTGLTPSGTSGGYCSRMEMASDIGRIPTVASGSETTYECDGLWFNNTIVAVALFGGYRGTGSKCGLSYWSVSNPATNVYTHIVASLSCKPPVAAA